jgi:hypothetical protein
MMVVCGAAHVHTILTDIQYASIIVMVQTELSAYNGPRDLIKKGRRFKAGATITKIEVATTTLIHDVVEA